MYDGTKADSFRRFEVITGVGRRRRWPEEEKARIVAESLDPATTSSAVARRYGLHASQLFIWRQQLQRQRWQLRGSPAFVPVVLAAEDNAAPAEPAGRMEIALGPAVVQVGVDVDAAARTTAALLEGPAEVGQRPYREQVDAQQRLEAGTTRGQPTPATCTLGLHAGDPAANVKPLQPM